MRSLTVCCHKGGRARYVPDKEGFVRGCWVVVCGLEIIMLKLGGRGLRVVFLGVDCGTSAKSVSMSLNVVP